MDATTLRILLFVVGVIFLGGIYLYEMRRRKRESTQARRRVSPRVDHSIHMSATEAEPEEDESESIEGLSDGEPDLDESTELLDREETEKGIDTFRIDDEPIPGIDEPVSGPESADKEELAEASMEQQELFGFSAQEESPVDVPDLIIQINLRARKAPFEGPAIEAAIQETGLILSPAGIYQRLASDGSRKVLYNLASMVEPGVFPAEAMIDFSTPGLTLFVQLPGPGESMMIFSDMLYTAERLAAMLEGDLQDETHSALTKQTIEHLRERVMEHKRQIQLARRKG
jgi:cell division protein ZipA